MSGIYVHIPFCKQACSYCDFYFTTRDKHLPFFLETLKKEINQLPAVLTGLDSYFEHNDWSPDSTSLFDHVETLYFGGGTPSRLESSQIDDVLQSLRSVFNLKNLKEFTIEVNPEDVSPSYISELKDLGVSRLSMGIQTFQPILLEFMHRAHSSQQAENALAIVNDAGFESYSVDLIYGCPNQSVEDIEDDLNRLLSFNPPHISAYALTIEPKTRIGKQYKLGRIDPADDDDVVKQANHIRQILEKHQIHRYEISNYAAAGHRAQHNASYWSHESYIGLGPSAHSFMWSKNGSTAARYQNPDSLAGYRDDILNQTAYKASFDIQTLKSLAEERMLLSLRTSDGILSRTLDVQYGYTWSQRQIDTMSQLRNHGLLEKDEPVRLTPKAMNIADSIILNLISNR